jgi:hypothetical protein
MDTMDKHFHPMNRRSDVEGMNTVDTDMGDRAVELDAVEREPEGVALMRHWIGDGAVRHHRNHRERKKLVKPGCSKDQLTFATHAFSYSSS